VGNACALTLASMEQRISYLLGCDNTTASAARQPAFEGGCFGIEGNVPSILRGLTEGFMASILIRPNAGAITDLTPTPGATILAGCIDFAGEAGWTFFGSGGFAYGVSVGDRTVLLPLLKPLKDTLMTFAYVPGAGGEGSDGALFVYCNGVLMDEQDVDNFAPGPDFFSIGGTNDPQVITDLGVNLAWGNLNCNIGGLAVYPLIAEPDGSPFQPTSSPFCEQFEAVYQALDMVNVRPSATPGASQAPEFPEASYLWSVRRGLPQIRDNGNEVWTDEIAGLELPRVGTQAGATVSAHAPQWNHYLVE
jgi:hypothetical protein